jgi:type VI protein secretion system component VasK
MTFNDFMITIGIVIGCLALIRLLLMAAVWLAGSTLSVALEAIGKVLIWIGSGIVWLVLLPVGFVAERIHDWREDRYFRKARAREKARQEESEDDLI